MNDIDLLQIKIETAKKGLSKETLHAISSIDWRNILSTIGQKKGYTTEQIDDLGLETELLLCGLLLPDEYPKKLQEEVQIPKDQVDMLINEINQQIFKKISDTLVKTLESGMIFTSHIPKPTTIKPVLVNDPKFASLPKEVQTAISESGYQPKLYAIAREKKLSINQMQGLEEVTNKVLLNVIHPDKYEEELKAKLELSADKVSEIVSEVNENILKNIREILRTHWDGNKKEEMGINDEVPIPPYAIETIIKTEVPTIVSPAQVVKEVPQLSKVESGIYQNAGIEMISGEKEPVEDLNRNIIASKLSSITSSKPTTSDHSIPKVTPPTSTPSVKPHDPYHEAI